MADESEEKAAPPQTILKFVWTPSTGEFTMEGPPRAVCYQMMGIALEKLVLHALMEQMEAERKRVISH